MQCASEFTIRWHEKRHTCRLNTWHTNRDMIIAHSSQGSQDATVRPGMAVKGPEVRGRQELGKSALDAHRKALPISELGFWISEGLTQA